MVTAGPTGVSSILLSAPGFDDRFDLWAGPVFAMLESCVGAIQAEEIVGVVCFHPRCEFRCGLVESCHICHTFVVSVLLESATALKNLHRVHRPLLADVTPDGQSWPGFGHMHSVPRLKKWYDQYVVSSTSPAASGSLPLSDDEIAAGGAWQRRTPHATINVLRAEQLEAAEGRRSTGELYGRNIRVLVGKGGGGGGVGLDKLAEDLERERRL